MKSSSKEVLAELKAGAKETKSQINNPGGGSCAFYAFGIGLIPHLRIELSQKRTPDILEKLFNAMAIKDDAQKGLIIDKIMRFDFTLPHNDKKQDAKLYEFFNDGFRHLLFNERIRQTNEILQGLAEGKELPRKLFGKDQIFNDAWAVFSKYYFDMSPEKTNPAYINSHLRKAIQTAANQLRTKQGPDINQLTKQAQEKYPTFNSLSQVDKMKRLETLWKESNASKEIGAAFAKLICFTSPTDSPTVQKGSAFQQFLQIKLDTKFGYLNKSGWGDSSDLEKLSDYLQVEYRERTEKGESLPLNAAPGRPVVHLNNRGGSHWSTLLDTKDALRLQEKYDVAYAVDPKLKTTYATQPILSVEEIKAVFSQYPSVTRHHGTFAQKIMHKCDEKGVTSEQVLQYITEHLPLDLKITGEFFKRLNYVFERSRMSVPQKLEIGVEKLNEDIKNIDSISKQWEFASLRERDVVSSIMKDIQQEFDQLKTAVSTRPLDSKMTEAKLEQLGRRMQDVQQYTTENMKLRKITDSVFKMCQSMGNVLGIKLDMTIKQTAQPATHTAQPRR